MSYEIRTPVTYVIKFTYKGTVWNHKKVYYYLRHALRSYLHFAGKYQGIRGIQLHAYIGDSPVMMIDVNSLINK